MLNRNFSKKQYSARECQCTLSPFLMQNNPHKTDKFLTRLKTEADENIKQYNYSMEIAKYSQDKSRKYSLRTKEKTLQNQQNIAPGTCIQNQSVAFSFVPFENITHINNVSADKQKEVKRISEETSFTQVKKELIGKIQGRPNLINQKRIQTYESTVASLSSFMKSNENWVPRNKINIVYPRRDTIAKSFLNTSTSALNITTTSVINTTTSNSNISNENMFFRAKNRLHSLHQKINTKSLIDQNQSGQQSNQMIESQQRIITSKWEIEDFKNQTPLGMTSKLSELFFKKTESIAGDDSEHISEIADSSDFSSSEPLLNEDTWNYSLKDILRKKLQKLNSQNK